MDDFGFRLLGAIAEAERLAQYRDASNEHLPPKCADQSWHTMTCGYYQGEHMEPCDCPVPAAILRRCAADRKLVEAFQQASRDFNEIDAERSSRAEALYLAVSLVAEGYGITEDQEDS